MSAGAALERDSAEHRQAIADCAAAIRTVARSDWDRRPAERKWSPAEIAEHLAIAYEPPLSELNGGPGFRMVVPWWKRPLLRWTVLPGIRRGRFPSGAPAPREIRPASGSADPEQAAARLSEQAERFLGALEASCRERTVRLTHAYFGKIGARDVVRLLTSHARHHGRQLSPPISTAPR